MMKLTPERAIELRKRGIKVDSSKIIREEKEETFQPKVNVATFDPVPQLINLAKVSEDNTSKLIELNVAVTKALQEISRPKEKKKYISLVHRDNRGNINQVDTNEI